jgi:hypothetical protein
LRRGWDKGLWVSPVEAIRRLVFRGIQVIILQELDRLEEEMRGAIAPRRLECDEDALVGPAVDAVLGASEGGGVPSFSSSAATVERRPPLRRERTDCMF